MIKMINKNIIIEIRNRSGKCLFGDRIPVTIVGNGDDMDDMYVEAKIAGVAAQEEDRSPLSDDALTLSELHTGMHISVRFSGQFDDRPWYDAIVTGNPEEELGDVIVPLAILRPAGGVNHTFMSASAMGMTKGKGGWSKRYYTIRIA